jgi:hypothetical protein
MTFSNSAISNISTNLEKIGIRLGICCCVKFTDHCVGLLQKGKKKKKNKPYIKKKTPEALNV